MSGRRRRRRAFWSLRASRSAPPSPVSGKEHGELLAPVADGEVEVADVLAQDVGEETEHVVSRLVPVAVVDQLEVVEVGEHERERIAEAFRAAHLDGERFGEAATIRELGELVGDGLALHGPVQAFVLDRDRRLRREPVRELLGLLVERTLARRIEEQATDAVLVRPEPERQRAAALLRPTGPHDLRAAADETRAGRARRLDRALEDHRQERLRVVRGGEGLSHQRHGLPDAALIAAAADVARAPPPVGPSSAAA